MALFAQRNDDDGGWEQVWAFGPAEVLERTGRTVAQHHAELEAEDSADACGHIDWLCEQLQVPNYAAWGGPGRSYCDGTSLRRASRRIVFRRMGGLDI